MIDGPSQRLHLFTKDLLEHLYEQPNSKLVNTLAMLVTGVILGHHCQLWMIAIVLPLDVQVSSTVRRFERFLADKRVDVQSYFEPFVWAMHSSLGQETAYVILDCTQAGPKCRTLVAGLAYHGTVLPLGWKTYKGKKGHLKGERHRDLLIQIAPYLRSYRQVIVLGDAEFSSEPVIGWLLKQRWDFVLRFQHRYQVQIEADGEWQTMKTVYETAGMEADQVKHWEKATYTQKHQQSGLTLTVHWGEGQDEPLCLVSSLPASACPEQVYQMRPWIETLFGNQKSRGFNLARTHLTIPEQIDRLFLALAIATCMLLGLGTHIFITKQTKWVDRSDRRDLSLFQLGFRSLLRFLALNRLHKFKMYFRWDFQLPPPGFQPS